MNPSGKRESCEEERTDQEELEWKDKPLHDMNHQQIEELADIEKSYKWLGKAGLKDSTEALIMAGTGTQHKIY